MTPTTILFVWTMVAAGSSGREYMDWRALAEFTTPQNCQKAVERMGNVTPDRVRCVAK